MNISEATVKDFLTLPVVDGFRNKEVYDSIILLPAQPVWWDVLRSKVIKLFLKAVKKTPTYELEVLNHMHNSGYRLVSYVLVKDGQAVARTNYHTDGAHLTMVAARWGLDFLAKSGLFRVIGNWGLVYFGNSIFAIPREKVEKTTSTNQTIEV